jgi:hypothetical protein
VSPEDPAAGDPAAVPTWAAPLTREQYAAARRCAAAAPPLSPRQRAQLRAIFAATPTQN